MSSVKLSGLAVPPENTPVYAAYKLFRLRKNGTLGSLFIDRKKVLPVGVWLEAECLPTPGYAFRPGWHVTLKPEAPHLSMKGRVWRKVLVACCAEWPRPKSQGGMWLTAAWMFIPEESNKELPQ